MTNFSNQQVADDHEGSLLDDLEDGAFSLPEDMDGLDDLEDGAFSLPEDADGLDSRDLISNLDLDSPQDQQMDPELAITFQQFPTRYIHSSWVMQLTHGELIAKLLAKPNTERHLSEYLLTEFNLTNDAPLDLEHQLNRIAAGNADALVKTIDNCGLVMNSPKLKMILSREHQQLIKDTIGRDAYLFSLNRSSFVTNEFLPELRPGYENWEDLAGFADYLSVCGMRCLGAAFYQAPKEITQRLLFKFPHGLSSEFMKGQEQCTHELQNKAALIVYKIFKEVS